jgi:AmmeMemoRadiSam system protein B
MVELAPDSPSFPLAEFPRLRSIEIFPTNDRSRRGFVLRDPADPSINPIVVSDGAAEVLVLLDGSRTVPQLSTALLLRGASITENQLRSFLYRLDEAGFLEGPRATFRAEQRKADFLTLPVRPAAHAGGAYPVSASELSAKLAAGYVDPAGPRALPGLRASNASPIRAAIAPHVDLHRGAPTYSWAYKALAEAQPAELYVVLGTCHTPVDGHFAATRKAYDTPLGLLPTSVDFMERFARIWGHDPFKGEISHAGEHSIEFQAVYLRSLGLASESAAPIVPILCDSLHSMVPFGKTPREVGLVESFVSALGESIASDGRRITLIAAVDLAHVGRRFGDHWPVDATRASEVGCADRAMLELILAADADAYFADVMRDRDARRICGFTPLYVLTALMQAEARQGELLRYTQWVDADLSSSVTFASAIFR